MELYMADGYFVDLVAGVRVRFFCIEDLFDGERANCVFSIIAL
jgi:hypothetical protein